MSNDFWGLSTGETAQTTETTYEAPSGGADYVFADGTKVKALIEEAKWHSFDGGERFINLRWTILAPETDLQGVKIANRKVFQKVYPFGDVRNSKTDEKITKKADNAKRMLGAINANTGNKLTSGEPTDEQLASAFCMKPIVIRLGVYEFDGKAGNWVSAVAPGNAATEVSGQHVMKSGAKAMATPGGSKSSYKMDDGDDVPF